MSSAVVRRPLPRPTDRLPLGSSGLTVSPICIGITDDPETIPAAFDAGINFFFLTADLHWPLYQGLRDGLELLCSRGGSVADQIVVGVVSYLEQPMFQHLQFHEVLDSVKGLERVDLLIAGAVSSYESLNARYEPIARSRSMGHHGSLAIGGSFHSRQAALLSLTYNYLDINYIRYNTGHPKARQEIFPYLRPGRSLIFNFKSTMSRVPPEQFQLLGLSESYWLPKVTDYYRFVFTNPNFDGVLCSPANIEQLEELLAALEEGALTPEEEEYMIWLSTISTPQYF